MRVKGIAQHIDCAVPTAKTPIENSQERTLAGARCPNERDALADLNLKISNRQCLVVRTRINVRHVLERYCILSHTVTLFQKSVRLRQATNTVVGGRVCDDIAIRAVDMFQKFSVLRLVKLEHGRNEFGSQDWVEALSGNHCV